MTRYGPRHIAFAVALSTLAGYVDASGYLATGGIFVSFMSGNSTRLGVKFGEGDIAQGFLIVGVIGLFILGVVGGAVIARYSGQRRKTAVLTMVSLSLLLAAVAFMTGQTYVGTALLVMAMGAENAVFQRDGEVSIGLTYMTGALVKLGQNLAGILFGGPRWSWLPYLFLWLGLAVGATLGTFCHAHMRGVSLWPAVGSAIVLAAISTRIRPEPIHREA